MEPGIMNRIRNTWQGKAGQALAGGGLSLAILGQPYDGLVGGIGLVAAFLGIVFVMWGGFTFMTDKGKRKLAGGIIGMIMGVALVMVFGVPSLSGGSLVPTNPQQPAGAAWSTYYSNANPATLGNGAYPASASGLILADPGDTSTPIRAAPYSYFFFNVTMVPPAGANTFSGNVIFQLVTPVPTITNTSSPTTTGAVLATRTNGVYNCALTPNGGSASYQSSTFSYTSGTARTLAAQCQWSSLVSQLAIAQYPVSFSLSFTLTDAASGALYGTLAMTFTLSYTEVGS